MVQEEVPRWLRNKGRGWMTAEYSLLPASTGDRVEREASRGKQQGRTIEIQRLIGRALRAVVDFQALGERTLWLDCDVLQADGGTRCAAICGAYVAAKRALDRFGLSRAFVDSVAAVSVGVVDGVPLLDLDYSEDSNADTDMNVVMTGDGRLIEVQATAEKDPFTRATLDDLLALAEAGIARDRRDPGGGGRRCTSLAVAIPTLEWPHVLLRLSVAAVLGGAIGLERELRERQAGLRTHLVVVRRLGALHARLRLRLPRVPRHGGSLVRTDPTRIAAQIVSGIGFLGAGAIIRQGLSSEG